MQTKPSHQSKRAIQYLCVTEKAMERLQKGPASLLKLSLFFSFFFFFLLSSAEVADFLACLASNGVENATLFHTEKEDGASVYYHLLNVSIQNLRFTGPGVAKPIAIVLPASREELAAAILCSRRQGSWAIRIRSGGHSYEGMSSVSDETPFVIIDMMNLNRVWVDAETRTAWVEGGSTLGEIYYAIAKSSGSLGFSAGSCPTVGSGGHIGGGGFGLLSRKYGLAADNVVDAILFDSEGRILDREAMGEEVFWAIRGGGAGSWGAVYAWKINLVPIPETVTTFVVSRPGSNSWVAELVHKWQFVGPKLPDEFYLSVFVGAGLPETESIGLSATFKGFYLGPSREAASLLKRLFPELTLAEEDCLEMSWVESIVFFSGLKNGSSVHDLKDRVQHDKGYFKAKSDYVQTPIPLPTIKSMTKILTKEPKGSIILDPYGGRMGKISSKSLPFPHRDGNLFAVQYMVAWKEEDDYRRKEFVDWLGGLYEFTEAAVSKNPRAAYVNYLDLDLGVKGGGRFSQNQVEVARGWGEKYFLGNYDRLVRAKSVIDPEDVFSNPQSIPPLASLRMDEM